MNTRTTTTRALTALLALASLAVTASSLRAQGGSLTPPPGAPAPVMHTLDNIFYTADWAAGDTAIHVDAQSGSSDVEFILDSFGRSFALTEDHPFGAPSQTAIQIQGGNHVLDLKGHSIQGYGIGIEIVGDGPITIRNGTIRYCQKGIVASGNAVVILQNITVVGCSGKGIEIVGGTLERVTVKDAVGHGIYSNGNRPVTIRDCRVTGVTNAVAGIEIPNGTVTGTTVADVSGSSADVTAIKASLGRVESSTVFSVTNTKASNAVAQGIQGRHVADCHVSNVTSNDEALGIAGGQMVSRCTTESVTAPVCTAISGSMVADCSVEGVYSLSATNHLGISGWAISRCHVTSVSAGTGIEVKSCGNATDCVVLGCTTGISCGTSCRVSDNSVAGVYQTGILVTGAGTSRIVNNVVNGLGGSTLRGILSTGGDRSIFDGNSVSNCATGFNADTASSTVFVRNTASGCTTGFDIPAAMVIVTPATLGTNPNANIAQ